jgi:hypothetical protein
MPKEILLRNLMWRKFQTKHGRERYKLRQIPVELIFDLASLEESNSNTGY